MSAWLTASTLTTAYLVLLVVSIGAAVVVTFLGDRSEELALTPLGPITWTASIGCFGGAGVLALHLFGLAPRLSLLAAAIFTVLSVALFVALATTARHTAEQHARLADVVGTLAQVVTPIASDGIGVIATDGAKPPLVLPATSRHGEPLAAGAAVVVTALHGSYAEVAPLPTTATTNR